MKRTIFIITLLCAFLLCCFGCGKRNIHKGNTDYAMYEYEQVISASKLDSICLADTLLTIDYWATATFYDSETNERYTKRIFVKDFSDDYEVVYILTEQDTLYKIIKRIGKVK